jgi:hypothetical protein
MHLQTRYRFSAPFGWAQVKRHTFGRIVHPGASLSDDDMLDLDAIMSGMYAHNRWDTNLVHEHLGTRI